MLANVLKLFLLTDKKRILEEYAHQCNYLLRLEQKLTSLCILRLIIPDYLRNKYTKQDGTL